MLDLDKLTTSDMTPKDLDDVCRLEEETFADAWPRSAFEKDMENESTYCPVIRDGSGRLVAYAILMIFAEEAHLTNIAVRKSLRRLGIGSRLMAHLIERAESNGCCAMFLDVRASNVDAVGLYERMNFKELYRRKRYYRNPIEDAVVMVCPLGEGSRRG
jgi:ribosomal-protein-alanine N-acetyltransferase